MKTYIPKIVCLALFLAFSLYSTAQTSVGLNVGLNIANWKTPDAQSFFQGASGLTSLTGFFVSIPVENRQSNYLAFMQEIAWSQKGTGINLDETINGIPVTATSRVVVNNLEYGAYIKGIYPVGNLELFALIGPSVGMAVAGSLSVKTTENGTSEPVTVKESINFEEWGYKRFEWALGLGGGVTIPKGKSKFSFLIRYQLGLTDVDKGSSENAKIHNRVLNFSLGYSIN